MFLFSRMFAFQNIYVHLLTSDSSSRIHKEEVKKKIKIVEGVIFWKQIGKSKLVLTSYKVES